jgi:hypothetical protein
MMSLLRSPSTLWSLIVLASGAIMLVYFVLRFARVHLVVGNIAELERMHAEGILLGEPRRDYVTLTYLIDTVAAAVALSPEAWVGIYWALLQVFRLLAVRTWVERQTRLIAAYQAARYRLAVDRLQEMRA